MGYNSYKRIDRRMFSFYHAEMGSVMMSLRQSVLMMLMLGFIPCYSQEYNFNLVDTDEGLPSRIVYKSMEDRMGNRWYLSDKGIVRYDGETWHSFDTKDGYDDLGAFLIKLDLHGNIWIVTTNFHLYVFTNNRFKRIPLEVDIAWVDIDQSGRIIAMARGLELFEVTSLGAARMMPNIKLLETEKAKFHRERAYMFCCVGNGSFLVSTNIAVYFISSLNKQAKKLTSNRTNENLVVSRVFRTSANTFWFTTQKGIYQFDTSSTSFRRICALDRNEVFDLFEDTVMNQVLIGSLKGLFKLHKNQSGGRLELLLKEAVSSISTSGSGTLIITTLNDRIFSILMKAKHFTKKLFENEYIEYLRVHDGQLYGFSSIGTMFSIRGDYGKGVVKRVKSSIGSVGHIYGVVHSKSSDSLIISSDQTIIYYKERFSRFNYSKGHVGFSWIGTNDDVVSCVFDDALLSQKYPRVTYNTFSYMDKNGIWFSPRVTKSIDNVVFGNNKRGFVEIEMNGEIPKRHYVYSGLTSVTDVVKLPDQKYLIATRNQGLCICEKGKIENQIDMNDGLASNMCNKIVAHNGKYWICTNKGVSVMSLSDSITFVNYDESNFLINNEVNDLVFHKKFVYVSTSEGISVFPENVAPSKQLPQVFITQFQVNNRDTPLQSNYELPYTYNNINVSFVYPNPLATQKVRYRYVLCGSQNDTGYTEQTELRFSSLQSGEYALKIWARNAHGEWSDEPAEVKFTIVVPYWRTYWFMGLLIVGIGGIIGYGYWSYFRNKQKELAYQERLSESERKALRLQMNPHFIFNILNSLQRFILQHQPLEANKYISKLATLMRWVMINAEKQTVSIEREIKFLEVYIELEQLRLEKRFESVWQIDPSIQPDRTYIPPLIIQPIIENAIKYALSDTRIDGKLVITMKKLPDFIEVVIEDNGKGMALVKKEQEMSGKEYESTGIKSINERLKLLLGINYKGNPVNMIDLKDVNLNSIGTKVTLIIPYESE